MFTETHARSVTKALSWRIAGSLTTAAIAFAFLRRWDLAAAAGGLDFVAKVAIYYAHERVWDRIRFGKRAITPAVLWFTGLPGSGKTTLARALVEELEKQGLRAEHLDGDTIRDLFPATGFSPEEREEHVKRVGFLASRLERNGLFVVVSLISPSRTGRDFSRRLCGRFIEIHVSTPLAECERRDPKGLYGKARRGELRDFTGVSAPYEAPLQPELALDTSVLSPEEATRAILALLKGRS